MEARDARRFREGARGEREHVIHGGPREGAARLPGVTRKATSGCAVRVDARTLARAPMRNPFAVLPLCPLACGSLLARVGDALVAVVVVKGSFALAADRAAWPTSPRPLDPLDYVPLLRGASVVVSATARAAQEATAGVALFREGRSLIAKQARTGDFAPSVATVAPRAALGVGPVGEIVVSPDLDLAALHVAPPDQVLAAPIVGDEWIVLDGFHAMTARLQSQLPGVRAEARVLRGDQAGALDPIELVADTLVVDADTAVASIVWRGGRHVATVDEARALRVYVGLALPGAPVRWPAPPPPLARTARFSLQAVLPGAPAVPVTEALAADEIARLVHAPPSAESTTQLSIAALHAAALPFGAPDVAAPPVVAAVRRAAPRFSTGTGELDRSMIALAATPFALAPPRVEPQHATASPPPMQGADASPDVGHDTPAPEGVGASQPAAAPPALVSEAEGLAATIAARRRDGASLRDLHLAGANLAGVDLSGADLREMDLVDARLGGANLERAKLGGARLVGADLRGANLAGADASGADLARVDLRGANLSGAVLTQANLLAARGDDASLVAVSAARACFARGTWDAADFERASLGGADFASASLGRARFVDADAPGAIFTDATCPDAVWDGARVADASFGRAVLTSGSFASIDGARARFEDARLDGARFDGARLAGARFARATAVDAAFVGAVLEGAALQRIDARGADFSRADL
ncbi:MAG TPA: pentapeptide repeat-containing protein, partial [Byssovorax sp.]